MTAPLVAVGGVAVQILKNRKIEVGAFISEIGGVKSKSYKTSPLSPNDLPARDEKLPVLGAGDAGKMIERIAAAKADRDSVGGVVEAVAFGVPVGAGGALYDGIESVLSALLFGIPAVKGVEFGQGFDIAAMTGSAANDQYQVVNGKVETTSNNNGGIVGGMANGAPICVRVAFKPTPSIARPQNSVDLATMKNTTLEIAGRHDACVVPRAVVVVEAALALALLDVLLKKGGL
jgi:chorismate synthase